MRINKVPFDGLRPIDGYGHGFFRIGGQLIEGPVLILPDTIMAWGGYDDRAPLQNVAGNIDVLFLGTGAQIAHPPDDLYKSLELHGIGLETMATPAACRTYNVLLAEGRRIGAALLPIE